MKQEFYDLIINHFKQDFHTEIQTLLTQARMIEKNPTEQSGADLAKALIKFFKKTGMI